MDVRPGRSLGLLSAAHAVNHAFAVLLPPIFLAIIDEFGVTVQSVAFLAAFGSLASGLVQLSYAELTRHVSRKRLLGPRVACCSAAGSRPCRSRRAS